MKEFSEKQKGFGLIEILVSIAIFSIVAVMAITALLSIIDAGEKSQSLNSVIENLNVALETMARNVRTGTTYACLDSSGSATTCSTSTGNAGIEFTPATSANERTKYYVSNNQIFTQSLNDGTSIPVTAAEVVVDDLRFYVINAREKDFQPRVIMSLAAHVQSREKNRVSFTLQTTMTQRIIENVDIVTEQ